MIAFSLATISDRLQALTRRLDSDATFPGRLLIYDGPRPAAGAPTTLANKLLATLHFPRPSLDAVTGSVLTLRQPAAAVVQANGLAVWARMTNGAGVFVADMDCGATTGAAEIIIAKADGSPAADTQLYAGGQLSVFVAALSET